MSPTPIPRKPKTPEERFSEIMGRLAAHAARPALDRLVAWHADRTTVLEKLRVLASSTGKVAPEKLLGLKPKQVESLVASMRHVAGTIERLVGFWQPRPASEYKAYLKDRAKRAVGAYPGAEESWIEVFEQYLQKTPRDFHEEVILPRLLRDFADALGQQRKSAALASKYPVRTAALCQLIHHVKCKTGRFHDPEVRDLVVAALNRGDYDLSAHAKWRKRHARLISLVGPLEVFPLFLPRK